MSIKRQNLKFNQAVSGDFISTLRDRVNQYFDRTKKERYANGEMKRKTIIMICLYLIPYAIILSGVFASVWITALLWLLMSLGMAGIGLGIMHDANHGAYSQNNKTNNFIGLIINLVGANHINWKIQHNVLHHTYTNIEGYDDSLHGGKLLRFCPGQPHLKHHRFQQYYAWFLYSLQTIVWAIVTDFVRLRNYYNMGLTKSYDKTHARMQVELALWKILYFAFIVAVPVLVCSAPWWQTVLFFVMMQLVAGFILSCIFLPAHIVPDAEYPLPTDGKIDNVWAVHQLHTSCNFATGSKWFSWYVGGLNFQIEHHLFPNICHVHYHEISRILEATAAEYNLPYNNHRTFAKAVYEHGKMLQMLGNGRSWKSVA